MRNRECSNYKL